MITLMLVILAFLGGVYCGIALINAALDHISDDGTEWIEPGAMFDYVEPYTGRDDP